MGRQVIGFSRVRRIVISVRPLCTLSTSCGGIFSFSFNVFLMTRVGEYWLDEYSRSTGEAEHRWRTLDVDRRSFLQIDCTPPPRLVGAFLLSSQPRQEGISFKALHVRDTVVTEICSCELYLLSVTKGQTGGTYDIHVLTG